MEGDHVEGAVVPDEVRDVAALEHGGGELLRGEHEAAVAGEGDYFLAGGGVVGGLEEGGGDGPGEGCVLIVNTFYLISLRKWEEEEGGRGRGRTDTKGLLPVGN